MPILFLLFTLVPALELLLLFKVGSLIGGWNAVGLVILTGIAGAYLAKSEGQAILFKIQKEFNSGQLPANSLIHGLLIFGGGLLLLTPGFLTDALGLAMVFPGTRHILVAFAKKHFKTKMQRGEMYTFSSTKGPFGFSQGFYYTSTNQRSTNNQDDTHPEREVIEVTPEKITDSKE